MIIVIPAYRPDLRLVALLDELAEALPRARVVVVDDGSGPDFDGVFALASCRVAAVLRDQANRGKGHALRRGFAWASEHAGDDRGVVTADADGQHTVTAIQHVAARVTTSTMVLGVRAFSGKVPLRSRLGNTISRGLFRLIEGSSVQDTQTGLRGFSMDALPWLLSIPGDRYDYEFSVLLGARRAGLGLVQVPIETVYLDDNASSHFRPLRDSVLIYAPLLKFAASSLGCYALDLMAWVALWTAWGDPVLAALGSRLLSASVNFGINRDVVFRDQGSRWRAGVRYAVLASGILAVNTALLVVLIDLVGMPGVVAKVAVEAGLFLASYVVQSRFVFPRHRSTTRVVQRGEGTLPVPAAHRQ